MSNIEWTEETWNPIAGCTPVSPGCLHCYAATMSHRLEAMGQAKYRGLTVLHNGVRTFNGKISFDDAALSIPLKRKKPQTYFVNSMSDLFHKDVPFEFVDKVFAVMALCPQHTFQILTKRPERMAEYLSETMRVDPPESLRPVDVCAAHRRIRKESERIAEERSGGGCWREHYNNLWPLPNVWLGTSVENQQFADERIQSLLRCPAAVRFLSCEPLLGPLDIERYFYVTGGSTAGPFFDAIGRRRGGGGIGGQMMTALPSGDISWVIVGGESGAGKKTRPMHPDWARSIRDQCVAAGVPFFFKQWGDWHPATREFGIEGHVMPEDEPRATWIGIDGVLQRPSATGMSNAFAIWRGGKKAAGRLLDGREWNEMPKSPVPA